MPNITLTLLYVVISLVGEVIAGYLGRYFRVACISL